MGTPTQRSPEKTLRPSRLFSFSPGPRPRLRTSPAAAPSCRKRKGRDNAHPNAFPYHTAPISAAAVFVTHRRRADKPGHKGRVYNCGLFVLGQGEDPRTPARTESPNIVSRCLVFKAGLVIRSDFCFLQSYDSGPVL